MADKSQAIKEAKDAALGSVGFMLIGTKSQSDQLRKSSLVAARNVVAVRKQIVSLVSKFKFYETAIKQINGIVSKKGDPAVKIASISNILSSGGDAYKQKEAEQEQKPSALGAIGQAANAVAGAVPGVAAFALAIPFLLSPEVREMLTGFFSGFIDGLGLGAEALSKVKLGIGIAIGILGAYFTAKVIMSVVDAFHQLQKLAQVLGIAGELVATEKGKIDLEKDKVKKAGEGAKDGMKQTKKDMRRGRKLSILKKPSFLLKKIMPKLISIGKNFVRAIPIVGTVLGIGLILMDMFDIGKDIYDLFFAKDEGDEDEAEKEEKAPVAASAEPPSASAPAAQAEVESKPAASNTAPATPSDVSNKSSAPAATESSEPVAPQSSTGGAIQASSIKIEQADIDLAKTAGGVNIINVDSSTTVITTNKSVQQADPPIYSITVGA